MSQHPFDREARAARALWLLETNTPAPRWSQCAESERELWREIADAVLMANSLRAGDRYGYAERKSEVSGRCWTCGETMCDEHERAGKAS